MGRNRARPGSVRVKLLKGTESDILADGSLDYPDPILEQFDIIIASIHARHKMDSDQMTKRLLRALKLPLFKIWGHPLGRLLQSRPPFDCRMEEVLDDIAESRCAIEVNGDPTAWIWSRAGFARRASAASNSSCPPTLTRLAVWEICVMASPWRGEVGSHRVKF